MLVMLKCEPDLKVNISKLQPEACNSENSEHVKKKSQYSPKYTIVKNIFFTLI